MRKILNNQNDQNNQSLIGGDVTGDFEFVSDPPDNTESDVFLHSLETLVPDDIVPGSEKRKKSRSEIISGLLRTLTLVVCIGIFVGSIAYIIRTLYYYRLADEIYGSILLELDKLEQIDIMEAAINDGMAVRYISQSPVSPSTPDFLTSLTLVESETNTEEVVQIEETNKQVALAKAYLNARKQQNSDVYGYIKIANTKVDNIIVQAEDNEYYLNHSWKGDYLPNGAIFADYRCYENVLKNFNTILYGHHMTDGTMFNTLDYFFKESFFQENKYIELYTLDGIFTYEIFAVYITDMRYQYIRTSFRSGAEFVEFAYEMKSNSIFEREGMEFNEGDRILTLSTCTNRVQTERIAVQAKLVSILRG